MAGRQGHVYDWLRKRRYMVLGGDSGTPTHLLLDGGKAAVPAEAEGEFLNAYAASLVRHPDARPCVVELRTPVFRMFVDLDTRFATREAAERAAGGGGGLCAVVQALTGALAPAGGPNPEAVVCVSSVAKPEGGAWKLGFHVAWPEVLVEAPTALELRRRMLDALGAGGGPAGPAAGPAAGPLRMEGQAAGTWDRELDACVFRANGLRMPWSGKGRGDESYYAPAWTLPASEGPCSPAAALRPVPAAECLSDLRAWVHRLSLRALAAAGPTLRLAAAPAPAGDSSGELRPHAVGAYSDVLPRLSDALPPQYIGQKFTTVMEGERCFMLRSTSRYCFNLGRAHRSNNVYFVLTRAGISQRCYCRCETTEGRRYGTCKDFVGEAWEVPRDVLEAFFPGEPAAPAAASTPAATPAKQAGVAPMPSRAARTYLSLDRLMARSRPQATPKAARPAKRARSERA
jgi:hypothetical protein